MSSEEEKINEFMGITGVSETNRARFFLESSNWQLELAIQSFFENDEQPEAAPAAAPGARRAASESAAAEDDDDMDYEPQELNKKKSSSRKTVGGGGSGNVHNIGSFNNSDSSSDEEHGQAFFAGGSDSSGQQILGPPKKKGSEFVSEMFKRAKEQGAETVEDSSPSAKSQQRIKAFTGSGFTLGSTENDSRQIAGSSSSSASSNAPREFTLKMWSNGFSLDDGPLRRYDDDANREFLTSIMKSKIPLELIKEARGGEVHVNMEDHKTEEYVKPKVKAKPFTGKGHVLGSVVPDIATNTSSEDEKKAAQAAADESVKVDESQPTTNLQIRLSDGSRLVIKLNHSHTVGDLRNYIKVSRPEYRDREFSLLTTFPNKELTDNSATLKDANLLGAAILLRLK